jgi:hypothetical protein
MIYCAEERKDGYAVIGKGNDRSANIELTENQADKRAHQLANRDGHGAVEWKGLDGRFERCPCSRCKQNR